MGNMWYCDKQEYHNFTLYKRLFTGDLWHKYDQYKCHNIARRVNISNYNQKHSYLPFLLDTLKMTNLYPEHVLINIYQYIPN